MKKALVIIDVQNDYFAGGAMELEEMEAAADNCRRLLEAFRSRQLPLIHVQHIAAREGATFFIPGTPGCDIHQSVTPLENEKTIRKHYPNAFRETGLDEILRGEDIEELVICGAMSHMCIDTSVRAAFDLGYRCTVIADACATRDLEYGGHRVAAADVQAAFMAALSAPFAAISLTEELLNEV